MSPLLSVRGLVKHYGELQALRDVSFDAHEGELVAVVGANGAGKTTLLSIVAGIQAPSAGTVSCGAWRPVSQDDPPVSRESPRGATAAREIGAGVGWAPQAPALYSRLSVAENLALFARLENVPDPAVAVARMLEQTGLSERAAERVGRLSGGNRQRVNVAIGLIGDPPVLVLDEPSASLDPAQRERLWGFVAGLTGSGRCVLFSTHNVAEAQRHATRLIVLADGELLLDGSPSGLLAQAGEGDGGDLERALVSFLAEREALARAASR